MAMGAEGESREPIQEYRGYRFKISIRTDGQYDFFVWSADANLNRDVALWHHTVATLKQAERLVKQWIDDRQPRGNR
jgi:heme exporter protein D